MEANPQSNAAPPASQAALDKLSHKKVDDTILGAEGKAECTICITEVERGEDVVILPCKHWFHNECVVMWLKEHNTCPVCRNPIEGGSNNISSGARDGDSQARPPQPASHEAPAGPSRHWRSRQTREHPRYETVHLRNVRSPVDNEERTSSNRNAAGAPSYRSTPARERSYGGNSASSPPVRLPTSVSDQGPQMQQRTSPSPSSRRSSSTNEPDRESGRDSQGGHGLFSFFNRFHRHSHGSSGDQRQS